MGTTGSTPRRGSAPSGHAHPILSRAGEIDDQDGGTGAQTNAEKTNAERAIRALRELQSTLHLLTPREQWEVKKVLPFATTEWQSGMALSLKPVKPGTCAGIIKMLLLPVHLLEWLLPLTP